MYFLIRENINLPEAAAGAWVHLVNSLDKLLQQTAGLDLIPVTQPLAVGYLLLHTRHVSHNSN